MRNFHYFACNMSFAVRLIWYMRPSIFYMLFVICILAKLINYVTYNMLYIFQKKVIHEGTHKANQYQDGDFIPHKTY